ncbi:MAG: hypothetical protein AAF721_32810, partial [Myxococcota bacterium]
DHYRDGKRDLTWQAGGSLNHPSNAGVLAFVDGDASAPLHASGAAADSRPPFKALPLATLRTADSANFDPQQSVEHLFDACIAPRRTCATGTEHDPELWVRFDLGEVYELGSARLFGDVKHDFVTRSWDLRYRADESQPWVTAFGDAWANVEAWVFADLGAVHARYVEVTVRGDPGQGVEATELELYGRPIRESAQ